MFSWRQAAKQSPGTNYAQLFSIWWREADAALLLKVNQDRHPPDPTKWQEDAIDTPTRQDTGSPFEIINTQRSIFMNFPIIDHCTLIIEYFFCAEEDASIFRGSLNIGHYTLIIEY